MPFLRENVLAFVIMRLFNQVGRSTLLGRGVRTRQLAHGVAPSPLRFLLLIINSNLNWCCYSQRIFFSLHNVHAPLRRGFHLLLIVRGCGGEFGWVLEVISIGVELGIVLKFMLFGPYKSVRVCLSPKTRLNKLDLSPPYSDK